MNQENIFSKLQNKNCHYLIEKILSYVNCQDLSNLKKVNSTLKIIIENYENALYANNELKMFKNTIFVQRPEIDHSPKRYDIGSASYHFNDINNSYINYSRATQWDWLDDDGKEFPPKKYFTDIKVDTDGTFTGTIDWRPDAFKFEGCNIWHYKFHHDEARNLLIGQSCQLSVDQSSPPVVKNFPDYKYYKKLPRAECDPKRKKVALQSLGPNLENVGESLGIYNRKVYVQTEYTTDLHYPSREILSLDSYHLESKSNSYIYYGPESHWELDNGQNFPEKKYFKNVFISEDGYFNGTISWSDDHNTTCDDADTWVYKFKQKEGSLSNCLIGCCRIFKEGEEIDLDVFGDDLVYSEWKEIFE